MSKAFYSQKGESLDYANTTDAVIEANSIVAIGARIGVVGGDIKPSETGAVHVEGVYEMPLADADAVDAGTEVYWNGEAITATSGAKTIAAGYAVASTTAGDSKILVKINA